MIKILSTLTGLAGKVKLIGIAVLVLIILICAVVINLKSGTIEVLQADNLRLTLERELAYSERDKALAELTRQNDIIAAHRLRMDEAGEAYKNEIARLKAQTTQTKVRVVKELIADPSCENKLRLIKQIQDGIYAR